MIKNNRSFSLIEVLVFTSISGLFFILAASVATVSLRNMKYNEHKITAQHYAKQLDDWLRTRKEIDWGGNLCGACSPTNFTERVTQGCSGACPNKFFCFNDLILDWPSVGACADYGLDSFYKREVEFDSDPVGSYISEVDATIVVSWLELGRLKQLTQKTTFSVLEQ